MAIITEGEYYEKLKMYANQIAHLCFIDDISEPLSHHSFSYEEIENFKVCFFFSQYLNDDDEIIPEFIIKFTVIMEDGHQITFMFEKESIKNAILNLIYDKDQGDFQYMIFKFDKPNGVELYDAIYFLEANLGIEI